MASSFYLLLNSIKEMLEEMLPFKGQWVCVTSKDGVEICGTLDWIGYNEHFPKWGLNCTISRMPGIQIESLLKLRLVGDRPKIFPE